MRSSGNEIKGCKICDGTGADLFGQPCACTQDTSAGHLSTTAIPSPFPASEASIDDEYSGNLTAVAMRAPAAATPLPFEESQIIAELEDERGQLRSTIANLENELQNVEGELTSQKYIKQIVEDLQVNLAAQDQLESSSLQARVVELERQLCVTEATKQQEKAAATSALQQRVEDSESTTAENLRQLSAARSHISALQQQVSDFTALCEQHCKQNHGQKALKQDLEEQLRGAIAAKEKSQQQCGQAQDKVVQLEHQLTTVAKERDEHASQHSISKQRVSHLQQQQACFDILKDNFDKERQAWKAQAAEFQQKLAKAADTEQRLLTKQRSLETCVVDLEGLLGDSHRQNEQARKQHVWMQPRITELEEILANATESSNAQSREKALLQDRVMSLEHSLHEVSTAKLESEDRLRILAEQVPLLEERLTDAACLQDQVDALEADAHEMNKEIIDYQTCVADLERQLESSSAHEDDLCSAHSNQVEGLETRITNIQSVHEDHQQVEKGLHSQIDDLKHRLENVEQPPGIVMENHQALQAALAELEQQSQELSRERAEHHKEMAAVTMLNAQLEERMEHLVTLNQQQAESSRALNTHFADMKQTVEVERSKSNQLTNSLAVKDQQVQNLASQLSELLTTKDLLTEQSFADQLAIKELRWKADQLTANHDRELITNRASLSRENELEDQLNMVEADRDAKQDQLVSIVNESQEQNKALQETISALKIKTKKQDNLLVNLQNQTFAGTPAPTIGFKLVAKVGNRYFSLFAGRQVEYVLGSAIEDGAQPNHRSGLYFCGTSDDAARVQVPASLRGDSGGLANANKAILECECEGPFVEYSHGKFACSRLTPIQEVVAPSMRLNRCASAPNWQNTAAEDAKVMSSQAAHALPVGHGRGVARFLRESEVAGDGSVQQRWRSRADSGSALS